MPASVATLVLLRLRVWRLRLYMGGHRLLANRKLLCFLSQIGAAFLFQYAFAGCLAARSITPNSLLVV